jgi:predicted Zn-dependent protease
MEEDLKDKYLNSTLNIQHSTFNVLALFFCCFLYACSQAPLTGRSQLILVSPEQERSMGIKAYESILQKEKVSQDQVLNQMLQTVGWRIANAARRPDFVWEFKLIENDKVANAFCLPGGKVFVYTGILKYTEDETGLATVIGHEVAHAMARHGAERMSLTLLAQLGETALSTHPTDYDRIAKIRSLLPEALEYYTN